MDPTATSTSAGETGNDDIEDTVGCNISVYSWQIFEEEGCILCDSVDDCFQDTGDTVDDSGDCVADGTEDGFDLLWIRQSSYKPLLESEDIHKRRRHPL